MIVHIILIVLFLIVVVALAQALFFLAHDRGESKRAVKALSWRVGLSMLLLVLIFVLWAAGVLHPNA
ncbi:MAG: twin transmembrane helix small protein [Gammaproteobacteria bacterium]|nr:twin transmembrane helix small protein [Gammaproteobacteria bacterium]